MIVASEKFTATFEELRPLLVLHNEEMSFPDDKGSLCLNESFYQDLEENQSLIFLTLRHDSDLIGYLTAFLYYGIHQKDLTVCTVDLYFVMPEHRRKGGASMLVKELIAVCEFLMIDSISIGTRYMENGIPAQKLIENLGFEESEKYYRKVIGENLCQA